MSLWDWSRAQAPTRLMRDFYTFAKESGICPDIEEDPYREVCDYLESRLPNTPRIAAWRARTGRAAPVALWKLLLALFLMPRLTFKTSLISALCIFAFLLDPDIRVVLGRATTGDSEATLIGIKSHIESNQVLIGAFGDLRKRFVKWTDEFITLGGRSPGIREPTIDTTGLNTSKTGSHPDLVLLDDLVHENNYQSPSIMELARTKVQAYTMILERWGSLLLTGTRWGDNDVYGWVLAQDELRTQRVPPQPESWQKIIWGCYRDDKPEEPRFPTVLPEARIAFLREHTDPKLFAAWLLNRARAASEEIFTLAYIQHVDGEYIGGPFGEFELFATERNKPVIDRLELRHRLRFPLGTVMLVDPAPTVGPKSDATGIVVVGFDAQRNWWVLHAGELHLLPTPRLNEIVYLARTYEPRILALENADLDAVLLQDKLTEIGLQTRVVSFNPRMDRRRITADPKLSPRGSTKKAAQIEATEPTLRAQRVFFLTGHCAPLIRQLTKYPYLDHDDVIDAFSMAKAYEGPVSEKVDDDPERIFAEIERREYELEGLDYDEPLVSKFQGRYRPGAWVGPATGLLPQLRKP